MSKKKKRKLIAMLAVLCMLLAAAGYTVFIAPLLKEDKWAYKEAVVERGTLTVGVMESGSLEYGITSIRYDLDLDVSSSDDDDDEDDEDEETVQRYLKIEQVYVAAGERIEDGTPLLKFTSDSVNAVRKLLQSALIDAQVAYNEAESEYTLALLEAGTDYKITKINEKYAPSVYSSSDSIISDNIGSMQLEIEKRTANMETLQEKLENANEDYADALEDYEKAKAAVEAVGMSNLTSYMTVESNYLTAKNQYESAKTAVTQAEKNITENEKQITQLQSQIALAQARKNIDKLDVQQEYQSSILNGQNAQITYAAQVESLEEDLAEALDDKKKAQEQLDEFEAFVGTDGVLCADGAGILTSVAYEAGDTLTAAGIMVSYATADAMTITVDVTQEDIIALSVGDEAQIEFHAYEGVDYQGVILSIDTTATSQDSPTVSYSAVIGVQGNTDMLYGGMTADIIFVTEEKKDVLYISKKAIMEENGKTYVYVKTALGGRDKREVVTGISNGVNVEIISGLSEEDTIYIASRVSSEKEIENTLSEDRGSTGTTESTTQNDTQEENMQEFPGMPSGMGGGTMPGGGTDSFGMPPEQNGTGGPG